MALTASKSAGSAGRISTVVPSASSAYACPAAWVILICTSGGPRLTGGSEVNACDRPPGRRPAELVADRYHARDVPDPVHQVAAQVCRLRGTRDRDDALGDRHHEQGRVDQELAQNDVVDDLGADLLVGAVEDGQQVGAADDTHQVAARVDHGKPLDLQVVHQPGGLLARVVWLDRYDVARHQVAGGHAVGLLQLLVVHHGGDRAAAVGVQGLLGQQVGFGDDADHLLVVVEDREGADPVLAEQRRHFLE